MSTQIQNQISELLKAKLSTKMQRNPAYSMRSLARDMGVSPAFVSQCMNGKKKFSFERARQFAHVLRMDDKEQKELLKLITVMDIKDEKQKAEFLNRSKQEGWREIHDESVDWQKVLEQWYHLPILDLTTCSNFVPSFSWVAMRLGIKVFQVEDAVKRLERLKLMERKSGTWMKTDQKLHICPTRGQFWVRAYHKEMIRKASQALETKTSEKELDEHDITGTTMSIDTNKLEEAKQLIKEFRFRLGELLSTGHCDDVYQLNVQLFSLTQTDRLRNKGYE